MNSRIGLHISVCFLTTFILFLSSLIGPAKLYGQSIIENLIPDQNETGDWQKLYEPQIANGEELYQLIDGGADIYVEYGFKAAMFLVYNFSDGYIINLEIYEMDSPESAYGIFTFKRGMEGNPSRFGSVGWMESYFLNFIKGSYLITIVGSDTNKLVISGIETIAEAVEKKINSLSRQPNIISLLPEKDLLPNGITYIKGNVALFNLYLFSQRDIFGLKEGVAGRYRDHRKFLLRYDNPDEANERYNSAKSFLRESKSFFDFKESDSAFVIKDKNEENISIECYRNWILVIIAPAQLNTEVILHNQKVRLSGK